MLAAETVRDRIQRLQLPHAKSPMGVVTASFGVAAATATGTGTGTTDNLMRAADGALYGAKSRGRNLVVRGPTLVDGHRRQNGRHASD